MADLRRQRAGLTASGNPRSQFLDGNASDNGLSTPNVNVQLMLVRKE